MGKYTGSTESVIQNEGKLLFPKEFIQNVLIDGVGNLYLNQPYESFALMSIGVEFLGKCITPRYLTWHKGKPEKDFEEAINNLNSFTKYRQYLKPYRIWDNLRNGFLHSFVPKHQITLSSKGQLNNLHIHDGKLNLRCEDFYFDFKSACKEVIEMEFQETSKMNKPFLLIP